MSKIDAKMAGAKCTCTRDVQAQTSTIDPECPFHGHGAEVQPDAQTDAQTGASVDSGTGEAVAD